MRGPGRRAARESEDNMRKDSFERTYNVKIEDIPFFPSDNGMYELAFIDKFVVYNDGSDYYVTTISSNSTYDFRVNLGALL